MLINYIQNLCFQALNALSLFRICLNFTSALDTYYFLSVLLQCQTGRTKSITKKISTMKLVEQIIKVYLMASEIENLRNTLLRQGNDIDLNLYHIYKCKKLIYDNYINSLDK